MLVVSNSQMHKLLSDAIGNGDEVQVGSCGKVPDRDQARNDLTKISDSAKHAH